jgi:hypothetical protein
MTEVELRHELASERFIRALAKVAADDSCLWQRDAVALLRGGGWVEMELGPLTELGRLPDAHVCVQVRQVLGVKEEAVTIQDLTDLPALVEKGLVRSIIYAVELHIGMGWEWSFSAGYGDAQSLRRVWGLITEMLDAQERDGVEVVSLKERWKESWAEVEARYKQGGE